MAKKSAAKNPVKLSPFQLGGLSQPAPKYSISKKVQAILDAPGLDSEDLSLKDRAVLVLELGKRLVAEEGADFHEHYLRHATPLAEAGPKASQWVFDALADAIEENAGLHGDIWYPVLPFLLSSDTETVERTAELMCLHHPGDGKSTLVGPESILSSMTNRASWLHDLKGKAKKDAAEAIAAGIATVMFRGDLRLLPALSKAWDNAGDEVREIFCQYFDGRITELQVELYLGVLEREKPGSDNFERAARHLSHCVDPSCMPLVPEEITVDRVSYNFGLHNGEDEDKVLAQTPARKYLAKIQPRLLAIKAREKSDSLVDAIIAAWQSA